MSLGETYPTSWKTVEKRLTSAHLGRTLLQEQFEVEIRQGDFREVLNDLEPESVKIILTACPSLNQE